MRQAKWEIMKGIEHTKSKIIDNNTVEYIRPDGVQVIRFHLTDILTFPKRGGVVLNSGGWKTVITKERMNSYQNECNIIQDKGMWYVTTSPNPSKEGSDRIPYFDGIKIKDGTVINPRTSAHRKEQSLLRQITAYCKKLKELPELPKPNGGDCWYCSMYTKDGVSLGDKIKDSNHIREHLKEKYIHGSLILNALQYTGYNNPGFIFIADYRDGIVHAVRKYFKSKLGLVV